MNLVRFEIGQTRIIERVEIRLARQFYCWNILNKPPALPATGSASVTDQARIRSAAFSPIMIAGALVLPLTISGIIDASAILNPVNPRTLS